MEGTDMSRAAIEAVVIEFPHESREASPNALRPLRPAAPAGRRVSAAARPGLRLTRRGRVVLSLLLLVALLAVVVAGLLAWPQSATAGGTALQVPRAYRTVLPGETLWQIAVEVAPRSDPRDTIASLVELNALETVRIQSGQVLAVPAQAG
jgi:hypothetical protein